MLHNISALLLLLLIYIFSFVRVSSATAKGEPPSRLSAAIQPPVLPDVWLPRSHGPNARWFPPNDGARMLEQRMDPGSGPVTFKVKLATFTSIAAITPVVDAAKFLEEFFRDIAESAAGVWQASRRSQSLNIDSGPFSLVFNSVGDTIDWHFIETIANRLRDAASRGRTGLFEATYVDDVAKIAISVTLKFIGYPDDSGGSPGEDYRDGSVPSVNFP